jgi:PAS domain-containing protein
LLALLGGAAPVLAIVVFAWRWWFAPWRDVKGTDRNSRRSLTTGQVPYSRNKQARHAALLLEHLYNYYAQLESRLIEEEFSVRAILSAMPDGLAAVDTQRRTRLVNPRLRQLFKLRENDAEEFLIRVVEDSEADACVQRAIGLLGRSDGHRNVTLKRLLRGLPDASFI